MHSLGALLKPEEYAVVATLNLNGDYLRPVGGDGWRHRYRTAPISTHTGHAILKQHGTAPDIVGRGANPAPCCSPGVMLNTWDGTRQVR